MDPQLNLEPLLAAIKKGDRGARDVFFENIWTHFTYLAHQNLDNTVFTDLYEWAKAHAGEDPELFALTNLSLGGLNFLSDNFDRAMQYLQCAIGIYTERKDEDGIAAAYIMIGFIYRSTGEIDLAMQYGLPGLKRLESSQAYKMLLITGYYWIGGVYAETGQLEEAMRLFRAGLEVDYPAGITNMCARLTNGIAGVYMKQKSYTLALENYQKALALCNATTESTFRARGLTDLGDYYCEMGDYEKAREYNMQALALRREMHIQNGSITNLMNLGDICRRQGRTGEAIDMLTQALHIAEEIRVKVKMYQIHQILSDIYLGMGNIAESLAHYKAFHAIREDVNHEDLDRKVKNQVQLFQAEQTRKENVIITAQKMEIEKKNAELQETIDELTLARISKKAKALTLGIAIVMFIFEDQILHFSLLLFPAGNFLLELCIKVAIVFSLKPINQLVEHYLLRKVLKKKRRVALQQA